MSSSYRQALRSAGVAGGATIVVALVGIVRSKSLALLVGPAGIGQIGVINSILATIGSLACLGLTFSGVRQIAVTEGAARERVRKLIWRISLGSALCFGLIVVVALDPNINLLRSVENVAHVGWWLALGLLFAIISGVQMTELQGMRMISALSRVRISGAIAGLILAIGAVAAFKFRALAFAVIAVPLGNVIAGMFARPVKVRTVRISDQGLPGIELLLTIGFVSMLTGFLSTGWQFLVRNEITTRLGLDAAGLYQAAFSLSAMNVGLVLTALAADFYPRLSKTIDDDCATREAIREQFDATLILGAPLLLALISLAPVALYVLFRSDFVSAWPVLQWQTLGDLLRLPGWVVGVLLVARAERKRYLGLEVSFSLLASILSVAAVRFIGLSGVGFAYAAACASYSCFALLLMPRGLRFQQRQIWRFNGIVGCALAVSLLCRVNLTSGVLVGATLSAGFGVFALIHLRQHMFARRAS